MSPRLLLAAVLVFAARTQEARSGFELRTTVSGEAYYSHQLSDGDNGSDLWLAASAPCSIQFGSGAPILERRRGRTDSFSVVLLRRVRGR